VVLPLELLNPVKALSYSRPSNLIGVLVDTSNVISIYGGNKPGPLNIGSASAQAGPRSSVSAQPPARVVDLAESHKGAVRCMQYNHAGKGIVSLGADAENKYWEWDGPCSIEMLPSYRLVGDRAEIRLINEASSSSQLPTDAHAWPCFTLTSVRIACQVLFRDV